MVCGLNCMVNLVLKVCSVFLCGVFLPRSGSKPPQVTSRLDGDIGPKRPHNKRMLRNMISGIPLYWSSACWLGSDVFIVCRRNGIMGQSYSKQSFQRCRSHFQLILIPLLAKGSAVSY